MTITFCTANKGYTKYLKQVYKNNLDVACDEKYNFVLFNYDSPDDIETERSIYPNNGSWQRRREPWQ